LFIAMNAIWFYFTFAENLGLATGQQTYEMPILATKLWGAFAPSFWLMVACMAVAFFILVVPPMLPRKSENPAFVFQPRFAAGSATAVIVLALMLVVPRLIAMPVLAIGQNTIVITVLWLLIILNIFFLLFGLSGWFKAHPVTSTVVASVLVVIGMWLERWNIIIPTVTHPMLVPYGTYTPSLTEVSISVASLAGFVLMFLVFFKLFPAISIWELAEGKVIEEVQNQVVIPEPEPNETRRRWGFR